MSNEIRVWDPLIRLFHWSLVLFFIIAYLSGDEESDVHIYAGYIVAGLILFRLIWGFIGSKYARFSDFVTTPSTAVQHVNELLDKPKRYIGHNPAGGWMVIIMLVTLTVVTISGFKVYAIEEGKGPLAVDVPTMSLISAAYADDDEHDEDGHDDEDESDEDEAEEFWEEIHETSSNFMVFLIIFHIAGVIIMGRLQNENLVKAMITGKKKSE